MNKFPVGHRELLKVFLNNFALPPPPPTKDIWQCLEIIVVETRGAGATVI